MQIKISDSKQQKQITQNAKKNGPQAMKYFKQLLDNKNWKQQSLKPQTYILSSDGRVVGKGVGILKVPFEKIVSFCGFPSFQQLKQYDQMTKQFNVLYQIKEYKTGLFRMAYLKYNLPFPFQNRDFLTVGYRQIIQPGKHELFAWKSFEDVQYPQFPNITRGITHVIGYDIQKINENQTKLISISDTDIKGNVPEMIKHLGTKHVAKKVQDIEKFILKKKQ